jgi:hypothetical protein
MAFLKFIEVTYSVFARGKNIVGTFFPGLKKAWDIAFPPGKIKYKNVPIVKRTEIVDSSKIDKKSEKFAKNDLLFKKDSEVFKFEPDFEDPTHPAKYNFKLKVKVNNTEPILAELDSDSHISLISLKFFNSLLDKGPLEFLDENPLEFKGMGSDLSSKHPPVMLDLQIGRIMMRGRFIITEHLSTSPMLIGSDFMVKNQLSNSYYSNNQ